MRIATWLKNWRKQAGYTQRELAELLGVQELQILRWENGKLLIPEHRLEDLHKIASDRKLSLKELAWFRFLDALDRQEPKGAGCET